MDTINYILKHLRPPATAALLCCTVFLFASCKDEKEKQPVAIEETLTSGRATILVDNTVSPVIEDVAAVFESIYPRATLKLVNRNEGEIIRMLLADSARVAVLPRKLTDEENRYFANKNIPPRVTEFAVDAVALITNNRAADTVAKLEDLLNALRGRETSMQKLVFDSSDSSTIQYLLQMAGVKSVPANIYSLKSNEEVIRYVNDNNGAVGIIGLNWLVQPPSALSEYVENIKVMGVDNVKIDSTQKKYYKPSQSNLGAGLYPLARTLYVLNYQGKLGLGMGFATYISAHEGQRIILKSGLLPVKIPSREIEVRNKL